MHEFALRAGVTVRTLHYYDRLGLLKPSAYTPSGHRLYGEGELARLQQIVTLKFIGFSLKQIKQLLDGNSFDIKTTLHLQRQIIEEKRRHLDLAILAIAKAQNLLSSSEDFDWEAFKQIIEVIEMYSDTEWMKKYYTPEQQQQLATRATPEVLEKGQRDWEDLIKDVEEAIRADTDPASETAQALAKRWSQLIEAFTGGDAAIRESLNQLYQDQENWPSTFQKPYSEEVEAFICQAMAISQ
ncbi:MerR family transcriptional regulator [Microseira wollei]|uniref:Transcriptional regulator, MerR family protein n=1 Tax=Microseira wollei NIES-4236 TaxID=2530354 RepID=A0AAV3X7Z0_9CYAN|nr:MerR family transcriptional regulator [Microseira wollei]GET36780.1 transcriptional regulator, MerR family protein [Microseira wollei NIES-4236]